MSSRRPKPVIMWQPPPQQLPGTTPARWSGAALLVEDRPDVRQVITFSLRALGFTVLVAEGEADATELCGRYLGPIPLLVMDVLLPGGRGGQELADALLARRPEMAVLFVSGHSREQLADAGMLRGDGAFLQKPFHRVDLARGVCRALAARAGGASRPAAGGARSVR